MNLESEGTMEKKSVSSAVVKSVLLVVFGAIVVLGLYFLLSRSKSTSTEDNYELTAVDEITTTNLEKNYPANPRKVVDLYSKIMQVLYKETYTDDQEVKMITVLAGIMDDELLANQSNFVQSMKNEVAARKDGDYSISTYVVQNKEPEVMTVDGKKMCNVDCLFTLRQGTGRTLLYYQFILRQDENNNWKILGWTIKENEEG